MKGGTTILAGSIVDASNFVYDIATDKWSQGASKAYTSDRSDEEGWGALGDQRVITYDIAQSLAQNSGYAEVYDPSTSQWTGISPADGTASGTLPVLSSNALASELGPELRLQDGRMFLIGGNQHTALYTPSSNSWAAGPDILANLSNSFGSITGASFGGDDAPAAELPNGHVILATDAGPNPVSTTGNTTNGSVVVQNIPSTAGLQVGWSVAQTNGNTDVIPQNTKIASIDSTTQVSLSQSATADSTGTGLKFGGTFSSPTILFDFDPSAGTVSAVAPALNDPVLSQTGAFVMRMLVLPSGQLLFNDSQNLFVYTPDGSANTNLIPVVTSVTYQGNGVFQLTGQRLNGQSAAAAYGDDVQTDENYPIVRLVSSKGDVYYSRSTGWNTIQVGGGTETVNFTLNPKLNKSDDYTLYVSGAGLNSAGFPITITRDQINGK